MARVISRRDLIRTCAAAGAACAVGPAMEGQSGNGSALLHRRGPAGPVLSLGQQWRFGGELSDAAAFQPSFADNGFDEVTIPHCVTPLSWQKWKPVDWEKVWIYRRHFQVPEEFSGQRIFLHFEGVMAAATPVVNGHTLPQHLGGFLPFHYEITDLLVKNTNVLALAVDSKWLNVPPTGSPKGASSIDYLLPGGITGSVQLRAVPHIFISDVFAKAMDVLESKRRLEITCTLDAAMIVPGPFRLTATLFDGSRAIAAASGDLAIERTGETQTKLTITDPGKVTLWDVNEPKLYDVVVVLSSNGKPVHEYRTRVGFREARFELDGFYLNGRRLQLFGLNRHELYPYAGRAMPPRVLRRDAQILRHEFNCNVVRCSHYPQSEAFLDACDELGLMVWEEIPGWQYVGDDAWQELAVRDVRDMVRRDRNHPSVIIWGVRINESHNNPAFYRRTKEAAKSLDDSRPTSGSMVYHSTSDWLQDVFAYDDYHSASDGSVGLIEPVPGVPFFFSEAVGQFSYGSRGFHNIYRRAADPELQRKQAVYHAQVHDRALANARYGGVIAWCAFEYGSLLNDYAAVKYPGVADVFRIPKLGASFYRAQTDPKIRAVIEPDFYWDFGPETPSGPGEQAAIFSNCDRLELSIDGRPHSVLHPDRTGYPRLRYAPFFDNLTFEGSRKPELRIDGYVGSALLLSRSFSADRSTDQLLLRADDAELVADGSDATRLVFQAVDKFGAPRPFVNGKVKLTLSGSGVIVGDNPFDLGESGGAGAVWIRSAAGRTGLIRIDAEHASLGKRSVEINVRSV